MCFVIAGYIATVAPSAVPTASPTKLYGVINVTSGIEASFDDCVVYPPSEVGKVHGEHNGGVVVTMGAYFDEQPRPDSFDSPLCTLYTGTHCTEATIRDASCIPPCLANSGTVFPFCSVFAKLNQVCAPGFDRYTMDMQAAVDIKRACLETYVVGNTDVTVAQFDVYVDLEGWESIDDFLADPNGMAALEAAILASVDNVVGAAVVHERRALKNIQRRTTEGVVVTTKVTVQIIPPITTPDVDASVAATVHELSNAMSSDNFAMEYASAYYKIPVHRMKGGVKLHVPVQEVSLPDSVVLLSSSKPTLSPTAAPVSFSSMLAARTGIFADDAAMYGPEFGAVLIAGVICAVILLWAYKSYGTYAKHKQAVDMSVLDQVFPPEDTLAE